MNSIILQIADQVFNIHLPPNSLENISKYFRLNQAISSFPNHAIIVTQNDRGRYDLHMESQQPVLNLSHGELIGQISETILVHYLTNGAGVALRAAAVGYCGNAILIAGETTSGKSTCAGWLVSKGFDFIADDTVIATNAAGSIAGLASPLALAESGLNMLGDTEAFRDLSYSFAGGKFLICPPETWTLQPSATSCGLVIFPHYEPDSDMRLEALSEIEAIARLRTCAKTPIDPNSEYDNYISNLAKNCPIISIKYSHFDQIDGVFEHIVRYLSQTNIEHKALEKFLSGFSADAGRTKSASFSIREPTIKKIPKKLTIGMATYDDFDGVYFSIQSIRLYHPEILDDIEFLVIDNNPTGLCAAALKALESSIDNFRYIPVNDVSGTAVRDMVFNKAAGEFVLCMDCHVLFAPDAITRLLDYFAQNPMSHDLLQGPIISDNLITLSTHFEPKWQKGMYGFWGENASGDDINAPPFDIEMQGLGVFACRRAAWRGFNPHFRGFGGEEGYIHEKFRQSGGRTLCLPFLRWLHRFPRPMGVPYVNRWDDRFRNYLIGWSELGLDLAELKNHMAETVGAEKANRILEKFLREFPQDADIK